MDISEFNVGDIIKVIEPLNNISMYNNMLFKIVNIDRDCLVAYEFLDTSLHNGVNISYFLYPAFVCKASPEEVVIKILTKA